MSDRGIVELQYALQSVRLMLVLDIKPKSGLLVNKVLQVNVLVSDLSFQIADTDDMATVITVIKMMIESSNDIPNKIVFLRTKIEETLGNDPVTKPALCEILHRIHDEMATNLRGIFTTIITGAYLIKEILEVIFSNGEEDIQVILSHLDAIMEQALAIVDQILEMCTDLRDKFRQNRN